MKKIFSLVNSTATGQPEIHVNGYIGKYDEVTVNMVNAILNSVTADRIKLVINSGGGSMLEGFAIYDAMKNSGKKFDGLITGIAGSMASVLLPVCEKVSMYKHARVMTHRPQGGTYGKAEQLQEHARLSLDMEKQVKALFVDHTGQPIKVVNTWFMPGVDKWFNAQEAIDAGIADEIIDGDVVEDVDPPGQSSEQELVDIYNKIVNHKINLPMTKIKVNKNLATKLSMPEEVEEAELLQKVEDLSAQIDTLQAQVDAVVEAKATDLVENAVKSKKIKEEQKAHFMKLAKTDYDLAKNTLDSISAPISIKETIQNKGTGTPSADDRANWSYKDWAKKDPKGLAEMRANDPDQFQNLLK